jgi:hypothetical protein
MKKRLHRAPQPDVGKVAEALAKQEEYIDLDIQTRAGLEAVDPDIANRWMTMSEAERKAGFIAYSSG